MHIWTHLGVKVLECEDVGHGALRARSGLHAVPPSVVGADELDDQGALGVEAGQAHGAHHGLGARAVEGDLWRRERYALVRNQPWLGTSNSDTARRDSFLCVVNLNTFCS